MKLQEFLNKLEDAVGLAMAVGEDNDGQLILYTGMSVTPGDEVVPFKEPPIDPYESAKRALVDLGHNAPDDFTPSARDRLKAKGIDLSPAHPVTCACKGTGYVEVSQFSCGYEKCQGRR